MLSGSMVAVVTPMKSDGAVDFAALDRLVEFHIANGTDAIASVGTTGESATLDVEEHLETIKRTLKTAAGRVPVIAGTGANSTREAVELTRLAHEAGVQGCLLVTPYYNRPTQEGLYRHYKAIAEAVPTQIILYNVPGRTACDMKPETVQRLSAIDNIVALKEASGSLDRNRELIERVGAKLTLLIAGIVMIITRRVPIGAAAAPAIIAPGAVRPAVVTAAAIAPARIFVARALLLVDRALVVEAALGLVPAILVGARLGGGGGSERRRHRERGSHGEGHGEELGLHVDLLGRGRIRQSGITQSDMSLT